MGWRALRFCARCRRCDGVASALQLVSADVDCPVLGKPGDRTGRPELGRGLPGGTVTPKPPVAGISLHLRWSGLADVPTSGKRLSMTPVWGRPDVRQSRFRAQPRAAGGREARVE
jgi:hypothetical protein